MPAMVISRAFWTALEIVGVPSIARFRIADEVERYPGDEPPPPYRGIGRPRKAKGLEARIPATEARFILEGLERDSWCVVALEEGNQGRSAEAMHQDKSVSSGVSRHSRGIRGMADR